jgi:hypothetical protein
VSRRPVAFVALWLIAAAASIVLPVLALGEECIDCGAYLHWEGSVDTPSDAVGVAAVGTYAYVVDGALQVIDVSDPHSPQIVTGGGVPGSADDVAVAGTYACVADYDSGLQVIDVSNPHQAESSGQPDILDSRLHRLSQSHLALERSLCNTRLSAGG